MAASRFSRNTSGLLLIDLQERLLPAVVGSERLLANALRLAEGARLLGVPLLATEQYPKGLGPTVDLLAGRVPERPAKTSFSAAALPSVPSFFRDQGRTAVVLAGVEAHVCVLQTALDLLEAGFAVAVAEDTVSSRRAADRDAALRRLAAAGAVPATAESILFEWLSTAGTPEFKRVSAWVRLEDGALLRAAREGGFP